MAITAGAGSAGGGLACAVANDGWRATRRGALRGGPRRVRGNAGPGLWRGGPGPGACSANER